MLLSNFRLYIFIFIYTFIFTHNTKSEEVKSLTYNETVSDFIFSFYHNTLSPLKSNVSECQFYPSCSHYSTDAISEFGFISGVILTGDRFMRCAGGNLEKTLYPTSNGLLVDNVINNNVFGDGNLWNLTFNSKTSSVNQSNFDSNYNLNISTDKDTLFNFAKYLFKEKLYDNSIYELRKIQFYSKSNNYINKSNLLISLNYLKQNKYKIARNYIDKIVNEENIIESNFLICDYIINDLDNANQWNINQLSKVIENINNNKYKNLDENTERTKLNLLFNNFIIYSNYKIDDIDNALIHLEKSNNIVNTFEFSNPYKSNNKYDKIKEFINNSDYNRLSPTLAAGFSTIIPGAGYVYAGHLKEGLSAFFINALIGAGIYSQFKSGNIGTGVFTSMIALPFYLGNIVGSYNTAYNENQKIKQNNLLELRNHLGISFYFSDDYFSSIFK